MSRAFRDHPMDFEWDENKRLIVLDPHGIDLEDAVQMFDGLVWVAPSRSREESRGIAVGERDGIEIAGGHDPKRSSTNHHGKTDTKR